MLLLGLIEDNLRYKHDDKFRDDSFHLFESPLQQGNVRNSNGSLADGNELAVL